MSPGDHSEILMWISVCEDVLINLRDHVKQQELGSLLQQDLLILTWLDLQEHSSKVAATVGSW